MVIPCPICSLPGGQVLLAKNGRPYFVCAGCKTRLFCNSQLALRGLERLIVRSRAWLAEDRALLSGEAGTDAAYAEAARVLSGGALPTPAPRGGADEPAVV